MNRGMCRSTSPLIRDSNVNRRRVDVFFYGLFMDPELLRAEGYTPQDIQIAFIEGFAVCVGQRAWLTSAPGKRAYGAIMSLTHAELERLYSVPSLEAYKPEPILAHLTGGPVIPALCYNLPEPPDSSERNPEYLAKLCAVAQKVGLPPNYLAMLEGLS